MVLSFGISKLPRLLVLTLLLLFLMVVFWWNFNRTVLPGPEKSRVGNELRFRIGESLRSTTCELTYPTAGSTIELWCSPSALTLATDLLPKDNGHTESLTSVRRTISTSNARATSKGDRRRA